jgi:hypothetical protein
MRDHVGQTLVGMAVEAEAPAKNRRTAVSGENARKRLLGPF